MSDTIIKLENISKQYRLGQVGTQTLRGDFQRWWHTLRGKEDPTLKIGQTNQLNAASRADTVSLSNCSAAGTRNSQLETDYVWALRDINLEVKQGEILGIIGKNGAGKSTLLKLLSRVTSPTTGQIKVKGRIASLLEVGTGFHPELTGRENIFLNGAIMGMTKAEIKGKFDEIVDFAGVAKYIDTPVKRYSSGMYVRLAFAVAAHLEPDILVVDEVLAVGDAEFQKKAIGKMQDISSGAGRTVLFVSHNMGSIKMLCNNGLLLSEGVINFYGKIAETIENYITRKSENSENFNLAKGIKGNRLNFIGTARISNIQIIDDFKNPIEEIYSCEKIRIELGIEIYENLKNVFFDLIINSKEGFPVVYYSSLFNDNQVFSFLKGENRIQIILENNLLPDSYSFTIGLHYTDGQTLDIVYNAMKFDVLRVSKDTNLDYPYKWKDGYLRQQSEWMILD